MGKISPRAVLWFVPVLLLAFIVFMWIMSSECTFTSVDDVRSSIERDLPLGSSNEQILRWISDNGYELRDTGPAGRLIAGELSIPADTNLIIALIPYTGDVAWGNKSIVITFVLDEDDRLADVVIEEKSSAL